MQKKDVTYVEAVQDEFDVIQFGVNQMVQIIKMEELKEELFAERKELRREYKIKSPRGEKVYTGESEF